MDHFTDPIWTLQDQRSLSDLGLRDILTLRPEWEGGFFTGDEERRSDILMRTLHSGPDFIDIESRMDDRIRADLVRSSAELDVKTIVSYHDHMRTPPIEEMLELMEFGFASGGDIVKLSARCKTIEDSSSLLGLAMKMKDAQRPYSIMGMGPYGHMTRVLAPHMGCEMVYTKLDDPGNTDQIDARTLKRIWVALGV